MRNQPKTRHVNPVLLLCEWIIRDGEQESQLLPQPTEAVPERIAPLLPTGWSAEFLWIREGEVEEDLVAFGVIGAIRFREPDVLPLAVAGEVQAPGGGHLDGEHGARSTARSPVKPLLATDLGTKSWTGWEAAYANFDLPRILPPL